jgi:hypothetical protein
MALAGCSARHGPENRGFCVNSHLLPGDAAALAAQHLGDAIDLIDRYDHGADGAYRVAVSGVPYTFKYWSGERAAALRLASAVAAHAILHQAHWPLPTIHAWHSSAHFAFVVEAQMPGRRIDSVSEPLCRQLLALLVAVPPGAGAITDTAAWVTSLEQSLYVDLPLSPCRPRTLQRTTMGQRFLAHARTALTAARPSLAAAHDVIHGDFSAGNILCDAGGELAAILDWQQSDSGHGGFDLVGLEWDLALRLDVGSAASLALVRAHVDNLVEEKVRTFCRAYYAIWNLSWALDTPDEAAVLCAADVVGVG